MSAHPSGDVAELLQRLRRHGRRLDDRRGRIARDSGLAEANHAFKAEAAMGPAEAKDVVLASSSGEKCDACCKTDKAAAIQKTASK